MMNKSYNIFSILILLTQWSVSLAQSDGQVEDRVVVIEKESKLELPQANRNFEKISTFPVYTKSKTQSYNIKELNIQLPLLNPKIKVPQTSSELLNKLYGNYIKAGFGNYGTSYLEGFINSKRSDKLNLGLHLNHMSSANGSVKSERVNNYSRNSNNSLEGTLQYFLPSSTIDAKLGWGRRRVNFYGYNTDTIDKSPLISEQFIDSIKQVYNTIELAAGIKSLNQENSFNYKVGTQIYHTSDRFKAKEAEWILNTDLKYKLSEADGLVLHSTISTSQRKDSSSISRILFNISPQYYFAWGILNLRAGLNLAYSNDTLSRFNKLHLYPTLLAQANLSDKKLIAFAGLDGEMRKNTWRTFVAENPFLDNNQQLYHTNKTIELYTGIRGLLVDKLNYSFKLGYNNFKNLYFYNNNFGRDSSRFSVLYSPENTTLLQFSSDVSYDINPNFKIGFDLQLNKYALSAKDTLLNVALHRPTSAAKIYATYNLGNKIYFNLNFYYIGGIKAMKMEQTKFKDVELKPILDLSLNVRYKVSETFGAFVEINNLLNNKFQTYQYYLSQGINVLVGVSYSF